MLKFTDAQRKNRIWKLFLEKETGSIWTVSTEFNFYLYYNEITGEKDGKIVIPQGFETDFGSIPQILWIFFNPTKYVAYVIHDYLYRKAAKIEVKDVFNLQGIINPTIHSTFDGVWKYEVEMSQYSADKVLDMILEMEWMWFIGRKIIRAGLMIWWWANFRKK